MCKLLNGSFGTSLQEIKKGRQSCYFSCRQVFPSCSGTAFWIRGVIREKPKSSPVLAYFESSNYKYWEKKVSEGDSFGGNLSHLGNHHPASSSQNLSESWNRAQGKPLKPGRKRNPETQVQSRVRAVLKTVLVSQKSFQELKLPVSTGKARCTFSCCPFLNFCCCYL